MRDGSLPGLLTQFTIETSTAASPDQSWVEIAFAMTCELHGERVELDALDVREREVESELRLLAEPFAPAHVASTAA